MIRTTSNYDSNHDSATEKQNLHNKNSYMPLQGLAYLNFSNVSSSKTTLLSNSSKRA